MNILKNPRVAENLVLEAEKNILGIQNYPYSYPIVSDPYFQHLEIRFLLVKQYVAFFQINETEKEISIVRFLYGSREWKSILIVLDDQ